MTSLLLAIVVLIPAQVGGHPDSLILPRGGGELWESEHRNAWYTRWNDDITIEVRESRHPANPTWDRTLSKLESASFLITADTPLPQDPEAECNVLHLFATGSLAKGILVIERWEIELPQDANGLSERVSVTKERLPSPANIGALRHCAIAPQGKILIAQRDDTSDVLGIDLATGASRVLERPERLAFLSRCNAIHWHRHARRGGAFLLTHVDRGCVQTGDRTVILWDRDQDGVPESSEEVTDEEWVTRGYNAEDLWSPATSVRFGREKS